MKHYGNLRDAIKGTASDLFHRGVPVKTGSWHSQENPHEFHELLNLSFASGLPNWLAGSLDFLDELREQIKPNIEWADAHFSERVSGLPLNPPPSHEIWPFAEQGNDKHIKDQKFDHTYPERLWPKKAGYGGHLDKLHYPPNKKGIRYEYGDLKDAVSLLHKDPLTRQAYIPIWFPEDTGSVFGGRVPCTLGYHIIVRHGFMHMTYYMRSCDFMRHFRDDVYLAVRLLHWIRNQLAMKEVGENDGKLGPFWSKIKPGLFTMHIVSFHCFTNELPILKKQTV